MHPVGLEPTISAGERPQTQLGPHGQWDWQTSRSSMEI